MCQADVLIIVFHQDPMKTASQDKGTSHSISRKRRERTPFAKASEPLLHKPWDSAHFVMNRIFMRK